MITWRPKRDEGGEEPPVPQAHPDFDPGTGKYKRPLVTPADYNAWAEARGLGGRCQTDLAFHQPELTQLCELWLGIANLKGTLPARSDFDAAALKPFMTNLAIVECIPQEKARSRYRFRHVGSELVRLFGDRTAQYADEYFPGESLQAWLMGYDIVVDAGAPIRFTQKFVLPLMSHLQGESFSAPLAAEGRSARGLLTALYVRPKEGVVG